MTKRYTVTVFTPCPACKGTGAVQNTTWGAYWRENPRGEMKFTEWFAERGYSDNDIPDEEEICNECNGGGEIETECSLEEALAEIERERHQHKTNHPAAECGKEKKP